jgi:hypothetical protein
MWQNCLDDKCIRVGGWAKAFEIDGGRSASRLETFMPLFIAALADEMLDFWPHYNRVMRMLIVLVTVR